MNKDLYFDENESSIVPVEFEEVCSRLRMKFKDARLGQFCGLVSAPIIYFLHPKKGRDAYFKRWLDGQQQTEPTILAGIAFQNVGDGPKFHAVENQNGLGSCGYGCRVLCTRWCSSKVLLLPGKEWSQEIQAFIDVADIQIRGKDYNLQVLAYNSLIMALEMGANDREYRSLWDN